MLIRGEKLPFHAVDHCPGFGPAETRTVTKQCQRKPEVKLLFSETAIKTVLLQWEFRVITRFLVIWKLLPTSAFRKCSISHLLGSAISFANPSTGDQRGERGRPQLHPWAGRALQGALGTGGTALATQRDEGAPAAAAPEAAPGEAAPAAPGAEPQQRDLRCTCWALHASAP